MPNTLAHIVLNGSITRLMIKNSDLLWIYLGCIIPDIPWIIRKLVELFFPSINGYDLQIFAVIQSSLLFSILLSYALASLSDLKLKTFIILSFGSILHLIFDMIQIKWANGVLFFAPFNWEITNIGIFWPENIVTYLFTLMGLIFFIVNWNLIKQKQIPIKISYLGFIGFSLSLILYFGTPFFLISSSKGADNHYVQTLENIEIREGKYVEIDRKKIFFNNETNSYWIESFDRSLIELSGIEDIKHNKISIKGKFLNNSLIKVDDYHENWELFRDGASYVGLFFVFLAWTNSLKNKLI